MIKGVTNEVSTVMVGAASVLIGGLGEIVREHGRLVWVCEHASFYILLGTVVRNSVIRGVTNEVSTVMAGAGVCIGVSVPGSVSEGRKRTVFPV